MSDILRKADFIKDESIYGELDRAKNKSIHEIEEIIENGREAKGLSFKEVAVLLQNTNSIIEEKLFKAASEVKERIYGKRIVRTPKETIKSLCEQGYLPSYCTACYRAGRTGDRFMQVAKSGQIHNLCYPNAMLTFKEYLDDYADQELKIIGNKVIEENLNNIPNDKMRKQTKERLKKVENGERDLFF